MYLTGDLGNIALIKVGWVGGSGLAKKIKLVMMYPLLHQGSQFWNIKNRWKNRFQHPKHSQPSKISKMEPFAKVVNNFLVLTICWQNSLSCILARVLNMPLASIYKLLWYYNFHSKILSLLLAHLFRFVYCQFV